MTATQNTLHISVPLDEKVIEQYRREARDYGTSLEEVIAHRLASCASHSATRPIYFDDQERQVLEKLISRNITNPKQVIQVVEKLLTMRINSMSITLKPDVLSRLRTRHNAGEFSQWLTQQIHVLLEQFVGLR